MALKLISMTGLVVENGLLHAAENDTTSNRPKQVHVGAIFAFTTRIGRAAKVAIQAAVDDVNASPIVLHGTKLNISMKDTNFTGLIDIVETMTFLDTIHTNIVAIIGPQSSVSAHTIAYIAQGLKVPLLSFAATDPALSSLEFPFFVRTTQNDYFQMAAIADIVNYFGWRKVTAIYHDDSFGRNGIAALENKLAKTQCTISYKAVMITEPSPEEIKELLYQVSLKESRIIVLHTYTKYGLKILEMARSLHMLSSGYVWIATDWLSDVIDTPLPTDSLINAQGLLTLRFHTAQPPAKKKFVARWSNLIQKEKGNGSSGLNTYGLHAYDTVWILAQALDKYLSEGGNISFSKSSRLSHMSNGTLHLDMMGVFDGGELLLSNVRQVNMTGLTGKIQFDSDRNLMNPAYDVINVVGTGEVNVGYWTKFGLSVKPPEASSSPPSNLTSSKQQLLTVIWPGHTTETPRGWVFPNDGLQLKIGVPYRISYNGIISYTASTNSFTGYAIDVFTSAVNLLPYALPHTLVPFGDGVRNPNLNELIDKMNGGVFDAVVGDIPITTYRLRKADFTLPYTESGLVVVAQVKALDSGAWAFLEPFTPVMWLTILASLIFVGILIWILEHRHNDEFRGSAKEQVVTMLWFSLSTWFFAHRETTVSRLGRVVLIMWLFVVLIINSSYTASLTSILTVQRLSASVKGIQSLVASNERIGYREGSYVHDYLIEELGVPESRLVALNTEDEGAEALRKG